jgi:hypothetical protein
MPETLFEKDENKWKTFRLFQILSRIWPQLLCFLHILYIKSDLFLRELQDQLSANPILAVDGKLVDEEQEVHVRRLSKSSEKRKGMHIEMNVMDQIKFADDEEEP